MIDTRSSPEAFGSIDGGSVREAVRADFEAMIRVVWWAVGVTIVAASVVHQAGRLTMNVPAILCLGLGYQLNSWLAVWLARRVAEPLRVYFLSHLLNVGFTTMAIHYVGGIGFPPAPLLYALVVANGGVVGSIPAHVLAFSCTAAYGTLVALETSGVLPSYVEPGIPRMVVDARLWPGVVLLVGVVLHVEAAYAGRIAGLLGARRRQLDRYRSAIEEEVRRRVAAHREAERAESERHEQSVRYRTFAHIITHDLKNPINAIYLTADLLLGRLGGSVEPTVVTGVQQIRHLAAGAEAKILDLMNLYRVVSTEESDTWVDLNEVVAESLRELQPRIDAKHTAVDVGPLPIVRGQYTKLGYVTSNLLSNAVKFVRPGVGRIEVFADVAEEGITLTVQDNGIGIPEEYRDRVFDLFARVPGRDRSVDDGQVEGTGVGLALVKRLVELHRGAVSVASRPEGGTRLDVWLPSPAAGTHLLHHARRSR